MIVSDTREGFRSSVEARGYLVGFAVYGEDGGGWEVAFETPEPFVPVSGSILVFFIHMEGQPMAAERHDSRLADGVFPDCIAELFGQSREVGEERETEELGDKVYGSHHYPRTEVSIGKGV